MYFLWFYNNILFHAYVAYKRMYTFATFYDVITQYVKTLQVDNQIKINKSHMSMFISNLSYVLAMYISSSHCTLQTTFKASNL